MIISIGPAANCPAGTRGLCPFYESKRCYAMKAERQYPASLPYRERQARYWKETPARRIASDICAVIKAKRAPVRAIRFNESGDFYGQRCVNKLSRVADLVPVPVYTYTARRDLKFHDLSHNLTVNGSGFMIHNNFKAVPNPRGRYICAGDCRICKLCMKRRGITIEVKYH